MIKRLLHFVFVIFTIQSFSQNIYVDQSAAIGGDGSSWALAYRDIQTAVDSASPSAIIFIAEGVYRPENEINISIPLSIKGGFPAGGGLQDVSTYTTQLQPDFNTTGLLLRIFDIDNNSDTSIEGLRFFNARYAINTKSSLTLNNVQFFGSSSADVDTGGNFDSLSIINCSFSNASGTSLRIDSTVINNIDIAASVFENGTSAAISASAGAGIFNITDCIFRDYVSSTRLATLFRANTNLTNVTATNNNADIFSFDENLVTINNLLATNNVESIILRQNEGTLNINNSTFTGNNGDDAVCIQTSLANLNVDNSTFDNNGSSDGGVAVLRNSRSNTNLTNSKFNNNYSSGTFNNAVMDITGNENLDILINIDGCEFKNNISDGYAALEIEYYVDLIINNSLFENNGTGDTEDLDLWYLDSAIITNNTFLNNSSDEAVINIGFMYVDAALIDNNIFRDNNGRDINVDRVEDYTQSNNQFYGNNISVEIDRVPSATLLNEYFEGNTTNIDFLNLDETNITISNSTLISTNPSGNHTLIDSGNDVALQLLNCTLSAQNYNDTHVRINIDNDLPSLIRNTVIWTGSTSTQSALGGNTSNLLVRHSLIKNEDPPGAGNIDGTVNTNRPRFSDPNDLDFRERRCSPTVNAGNNSYNAEASDILNNTRVFETTIDIGAYELQISESTSCAALDRPLCTNLSLPNDGETDVSVATNLNWTADPNAVGYILRVGTALGLSDILNETLGNVTNYDLLNDLPYNTEVFVRIIPFNGAGNAISCVSESFTTKTIPNCTALTMPSNGATDVAITTDLNWSGVSGAKGYILRVGTALGSYDLLDINLGNQTNYNLPFNLPENTEIFVRVIPFNNAGNATGCTEESFTTETLLTIPDCTFINNPDDGTTNVAITTDINWDNVANADGYLVTVSTTSGGNDILNSFDVGNNTTYNLPADLPQNSEIYVTIIPYNAIGNATSCTEESFTTETLATIPNCTNLTTPLIGNTDVSIATDLTWTAIANANGYLLTVGTTSGGNDILDNFDVGNNTTYNLPADLPENTEIFVTIIPYNGVGNATSCTEESFTTETLATIPNCTNLTTPLNGNTDVSIATDLSWTAIANANGYLLSVGTTSGGNDILNNFDVGNNTTYNLPADLPENTEIFVTIIPYNGVGNATSCTEESFTTETLATIPNCTNLTTPLNGNADVSIATDLTWTAIANANGYLLSVGTTSGGNDILNNFDVGNNTTYNLPADLPENTEIFVTIIPYNGVGNATSCTEESFTTELPLPECVNLVSPFFQETNVPIGTDLSWPVSQFADGYTVAIGTTTGAEDILATADVGNTTTFNIPFDLPENTTIYVTITAYNSTGSSVCGDDQFTTETVPTTPNCTLLTLPLNGDVDVAIDTDFSWTTIANANGYFLTIGTTAGGNDILDNFDVGNATTYNLPADLPENTQIYVTIIPYNGVGNATSCTEESFTTETTTIILECTTLTMPLAGATDVSVSTNFSWNAIPNANGYLISIGTNTVLLDAADVGNALTYDMPFDLPANTDIIVQITPYINPNDTAGCPSEWFTTGEAPTAPICTMLVSPLDGATNVNNSVELSWNAVTDADGYSLTIGTTSGGLDILDNFDVGNVTTFDLPTDLSDNSTIYVSIIPYNGAGAALDCDEESFSTINTNIIPICTRLIEPLDLDTDVSVNTDLTWVSEPNAIGYRLSVGTTTNGVDILDNFNVGNVTTFDLPEDLPENTEIFVNILPYNANGEPTDCFEESFITGLVDVLPNCTLLQSPANGSINVSISTDLTWESSLDATGYFLVVGLSTNGTDIIDNADVGNTTSFDLPFDLPESTEIFVTIIPYNDEGTAIGCQEESFTTGFNNEIPETDDTKYGFSPDGNGVNEFWKIEGIENYPNNEVVIYNRWGDMVFSIKGYNNSSRVFRGDANKKTKMGAGRLPSGTYFFDIIIDGDHNLSKTKGYVVIKR